MEALLVVLMGFASYILKGFIITKLWSWFVVPIFGLPAVSIPVVMGIILIVQLVTPNLYRSTRNLMDAGTKAKVGDALTDQIMAQLFYLLFLLEGWVIYKFFM